MGWEQIRGWSEGDVHRVYDDAVETAKDGDTLIEVGVAYGRSIAYLARKALDSKKRIRVIGVDTWPDTAEAYGGPENNALVKMAGSYYEACCFEMIQYAPEEYHNVTLIRGASVDVAKRLNGINLHFVFIDIDHEYDSVRRDIAAWRTIMQPGSVLAGHDLTPSFPGVERAVREIFGDGFERVGNSWRVRL